MEEWKKGLPIDEKVVPKSMPTALGFGGGRLYPYRLAK